MGQRKYPFFFFALFESEIHTYLQFSIISPIVPPPSSSSKNDPEKKRQQKEKREAAKERSKAKREALLQDNDYLKADEEYQRLKILFDLSQLNPERGRECVMKEFKDMTGLKDKYKGYEKSYGKDSFLEDLKIMENIVNSFVTSVSFKKALIIILLHFPTLNIIKTSLEKSSKSNNCFESATINLILKIIMLVMKANGFLSPEFDLANFNMLLFDTNPVKMPAQAFKGIPATDDFEKVFEKLSDVCPEQFETPGAYAKFRRDTKDLIFKTIQVLVGKAKENGQKVFIVEHGAWNKDFAKDLKDATDVIVESCCHPHKLLALFATKEDIRKIISTYFTLFQLADGKEPVQPTEEQLDKLTRHFADGIHIMSSMPKDSEEFNEWYRKRFGREYSDSPLFKLRTELAEHKQKYENEPQNRQAIPLQQALPLQQSFPPQQFNRQMVPTFIPGGYHPHPHHLPSHYFVHHNQTFPPMSYPMYHGVPVQPQQVRPIPQQLQERSRPTEEEKSRYGAPLDTFFYTHGPRLSDEIGDIGRVHNFKDPQEKKFKGTYKQNNGKYRAQICDPSVNLGEFALESDAAKTYDDFAIMLNRKKSQESKKGSYTRRARRYRLNFRNENEYIFARNKEIVDNR